MPTDSRIKTADAPWQRCVSLQVGVSRLLQCQLDGHHETENPLPILIRRPDGPYFSQGDERAFFEWLKRIPCITKLGGQGEELHIHVRSSKVTQGSLRELIAAFRRYGVSMQQLAQLETASNRKWFRDPAAHWYRLIFQRGKPSNKALQPTSRSRKSATRSKRRSRAARG